MLPHAAVIAPDISSFPEAKYSTFIIIPDGTRGLQTLFALLGLISVCSPLPKTLLKCAIHFFLCVLSFFFIQPILRNDSFNLRCKWLIMLTVLLSQECLYFNRFKALKQRDGWEEKRHRNFLGHLKSCLLFFLNRRPTQLDNSLKVMKWMLWTYVPQVLCGMSFLFTWGETTQLARQIPIKWIPWRQELVWFFPSLLSNRGLSNVLIHVPHTMSSGWMSDWGHARRYSF